MIYLLTILMFHSCVTLSEGRLLQKYDSCSLSWLTTGGNRTQLICGTFCFSEIPKTQKNIQSLMWQFGFRVRKETSKGVRFSIVLWTAKFDQASTKSLPQRSQRVVAYTWDSGRIGCNPICKQQPQNFQWRDLGMLEIQGYSKALFLDFMSYFDQTYYCCFMLSLLFVVALFYDC